MSDMEPVQLTELLHDLAAINLERAKAYEYASLQNQLYDVELRTTFALLANQSRQSNYMLNMQLEKLLAKNAGHRPQHGPLYDQWKSNTGLFTGEKRKDILTTCEAGEIAMLGIYDKALGNQLRHEMREMIELQQRGLQSALSTIKKIIDLGETRPIGFRR